MKEFLKTHKFMVAILLLIAICSYGAPYLYKWQPWIFDDCTNPYNEECNPGGTTSKIHIMPDGKVAPTTVLTPEEMKVQAEDGCVACHEKL